MFTKFTESSASVFSVLSDMSDIHIPSPISYTKTTSKSVSADTIATPKFRNKLQLKAEEHQDLTLLWRTLVVEESRTSPEYRTALERIKTTNWFLELAGTNVRFVQTYNGVEVWPATISVRLDLQGNISGMDASYVPTPDDVPTQPQINLTEAENLARNAVSGGSQGKLAGSKLIVYAPLDKTPRLAWKFQLLVGISADWLVVVDANDGTILNAINQVMDGNVAGSGVDSLGTARPLNVWQTGSVYYLWDASKAMFNQTNGQGVIYVYDARSASQGQVISNNVIQNIYNISSSSPNSWSNTDGVSAAFNFSQTYDYYHERFSRDSYDGNGSDMTAVVKIGGLANAFWNNSFKIMFFGDADKYAASLDVIGHELTHGVAYSIGGDGVLLYQNQSGALNEAFADIFGEMIESRTRGTNDWMIGSQLTTIIRNMTNPASMLIPGTARPFPATFSNLIQPNDPFLSIFQNNDNGGVHENSGIINRAFFLLAAGLQGAIGERDAEKIFYRCLTQYMQPQSQFIDARLGCISSAEDLFGANSLQTLKTAEAFDAVEIFASPASAIQPSTVSAAVAGSDSYMFVRTAYNPSTSSYQNNLYRIEGAQGDSVNGTELVSNVKYSRPSVSGNGADMFFVGNDDSLCSLLTTGGSFNTSNAGLVHSVALSPDERYAIFVLNDSSGNPTNKLYVYDLLSNVTATVTLVTPVQDGTAITNVSFADALSFSPNSKFLCYDALSRARNPDGTLRQSWSIFALDLTTLRQSVVIPPVAGFNIADPCFSRTSDRYITCDAQYTNGSSAILTFDLYNGSLGVIGTTQTGLGYPYFNGDDSFVIYSDTDATVTSGRSIYRQLLSTDKLSAFGSRSSWFKDALLSIIYRRGSFLPPNTTPTVSLTSPTNNASFTSLADIVLTASPADLDGSVVRVDFYSGSTFIGSLTNSPFSGLWKSVPAGNYRIYARAYDNSGASTTSAPVDFIVTPSNPNGVFRTNGKRGFELAVRVPHPGLYRLEFSTNLLNWSPVGSFQCVTNLNFFDPSATNGVRGFYRAVSTP